MKKYGGGGGGGIDRAPWLRALTQMVSTVSGTIEDPVRIVYNLHSKNS